MPDIVASAAMVPPPTRIGRVAIMPRARADGQSGHEFATLEALARRLARLQGYDYAGVHGPDAGDGRSYLVPEDTLSAADARALGVGGPEDLFGGVAPHPFMATKVVSHPVLDGAAALPAGWSHTLADRLGDAVLPGYSVFSARDARRAWARLAALAPLRLKLARGVGGRDQVLLRSLDELEAALAQLPEPELANHGATLEQHLEQAVTCCVGRVECAGIRLTYAGTQRTTRNRDGEDVYGGSDLMVARGGFDALRAAGLDEDMQRMLRQAQRYHEAMCEAFPGFFASRCNYDIVRGLDHDGRVRSGVLEQSWRIGGASPAEIAALEAFAADPALDLVHASSHEVHGAHDPPDGAVVHYRDVDPRWGAMTKYSLLERHGHPT